MNKDTGGPAFPRAGDFNPQIGMTLRDYFAARAMQAYIARDRISDAIAEGVITKDAVCGACYEWADAVLKARGQ